MSQERLVVIHNPNSTRAHNVGREVFGALDSEDIVYHPFKTQSPETEDNIADMREFLRDGDRVIVAAGDGTAMQAANALLRENHANSTVGFLPYGNFNDTATVYGLQPDNLLATLQHDARTETLHPLTIDVNGEYWRDAPTYLTMGWTAIAASQFGNAESRDQMKSAPEAVKLARSLWQLTGNYFAHRREFLPEFHTSRSPIVQTAVTDVLAINSPVMGRIIRSRQPFGALSEFGYKQLDVSSLLRNIPFGMKALSGRTPTEPITDIGFVFESPAILPIQSEGEFANLDAVSTVAIRKDPTRTIRVLSGR